MPLPYEFRGREGQVFFPHLKQKRNIESFTNNRLRNFVTSSPAFLQRLGLEHTLDSHKGCVNTVLWNETGDLLISGSDDRKVIIWDANHFKPISITKTNHRGNIFCAKFLPQTNDSQFVSCAQDGKILIYDTIKNTERKIFNHKNMVHKLATPSLDPFWFMSCGEDGMVYQYDLRSKDVPSLVARLGKTSSLSIHSICLNPNDQNYFILGGEHPCIFLLDRRLINSNQVIKKTAVHSYTCRVNEKGDKHLKKYFKFQSNVTSCSFSQDGREILASYSGTCMYLFNTKPSENEKEFQSSCSCSPSGASYEKMKFIGHKNVATIKEANFFGPKSEYVMTGSDSGSVHIYDKSSGLLVRELEGADEFGVNCVQGHPLHYPVLATSGIENHIRIWSPQDKDLSQKRNIIPLRSMKRNLLEIFYDGFLTENANNDLMDESDDAIAQDLLYAYNDGEEDDWEDDDGEDDDDGKDKDELENGGEYCGDDAGEDKDEELKDVEEDEKHEHT